MQKSSNLIRCSRITLKKLQTAFLSIEDYHYDILNVQRHCSGVFRGGFPLNISPLPSVQNSSKVIHSQNLFTHPILTKVFYLKDLSKLTDDIYQRSAQQQPPPFILLKAVKLYFRKCVIGTHLAAFQLGTLNESFLSLASISGVCVLKNN